MADFIPCPECKGPTATDITGRPWCVLCGRGMEIKLVTCRECDGEGVSSDYRGEYECHSCDNGWIKIWD